MDKMRFVRPCASLVALLLLLVVVSVSFAADSDSRKGVRGKVNTPADTSGQVITSLENDPRAVVKEGFFYGIDKGRVSLMPQDSNRKTSYRLEEDYNLYYLNEDGLLEEITLEFVPPHSIIKLILIEGQVREMILLLRSS